MHSTEKEFQNIALCGVCERKKHIDTDIFKTARNGDKQE